MRIPVIVDVVEVTVKPEVDDYNNPTQLLITLFYSAFAENDFLLRRFRFDAVMTRDECDVLSSRPVIVVIVVIVVVVFAATTRLSLEPSWCLLYFAA